MKDFIKVLNESLPDVHYVKLHTEPDCYGISRMISEKLHLPFTPRSFSNWLHGWLSTDLKYIEQFGLVNNFKYLVTTKEQECFFNKNGKNAKAVGAPYIYAKVLDRLEIKRQKNSLLVMPPHGLPYTNEKWNEEAYAKQIYSLKNEFDFIVACIHPSCAEKKSWIRQFENHEIPWVTGAEMHDKNALIRMHRMFQNFEYMTTNSKGSHIAYAAYSGCKVSIYGNYAEFTKEDVKEDVLYIEHPHIMEYNLRGATREAMAKRFPFLFVHPKKACEKIDWAAEQLGKDNQKSVYQLAYLLGWLPHQQIYFWAMKIYFKLIKETLLFFKK
jgi:hypothetical protein